VGLLEAVAGSGKTPTSPSGGGCYGSKFGETTGGAGQLVLVVALGGPREGVRRVGWLRERVGKGARLGSGNGTRRSTVLARGEGRHGFIAGPVVEKESHRSSHSRS
jgi:hypothetical protein